MRKNIFVGYMEDQPEENTNKLIQNTCFIAVDLLKNQIRYSHQQIIYFIILCNLLHFYHTHNLLPIRVKLIQMFVVELRKRNQHFEKRLLHVLKLIVIALSMSDDVKMKVIADRSKALIDNRIFPGDRSEVFG